MTRILMDTCALICFLTNGREDAGGANNMSVSDRSNRVRFLRDRIARGEVSPLIIPTPVMAEIYSNAKSAFTLYHPLLQEDKVFEITDFGERAAFRLGELNINAKKLHGDKWGTLKDHKGGWQKLKFDRQIIACADIKNVDEIYTDDSGLKNTCDVEGVKAVSVNDWPVTTPNLFDVAK